MSPMVICKVDEKLFMNDCRKSFAWCYKEGICNTLRRLE